MKKARGKMKITNYINMLKKAQQSCRKGSEREVLGGVIG
jgi:hypothetical protein